MAREHSISLAGIAHETCGPLVPTDGVGEPYAVHELLQSGLHV